MNQYFGEIKSLVRNFVHDSWIICIEISGLHLHAWTLSDLKQVASYWGEALFVDDDEDEPASTGRLCIKTLDLNKIQGFISVET